MIFGDSDTSEQELEVIKEPENEVQNLIEGGERTRWKWIRGVRAWAYITFSEWKKATSLQDWWINNYYVDTAKKASNITYQTVEIEGSATIENALYGNGSWQLIWNTVH